MGIHFKFEAPELFAVTPHTNQDVVRRRHSLLHPVVQMAGDDDGNVGLGEERLLLIRPDVGQDDDQVGLRPKFSHVASHRFHHRRGVPFAHQGGGGEVAKVVGHGADYADAEAVDFEDQPGLFGEQSILGIHDIGADHRVFRHPNEAARLLPAVVEVMVAEGEGVEAEEVGDFEDGCAFVDGGDGSALGEVSGV